MSDAIGMKPLYWIGSSRADLKSLPHDVQDIFGYALYLAQIGQKHDDAKPLRGFRSAGVLEVVEDYQSGSINLQAGQVFVDGGQISTFTSGTGSAGDIRMSGRAVSITGGTTIDRGLL